MATRAVSRIQFIVSSHSALVCQHAEVGGIFYLPSPGSRLQPYKLSDEQCRKIRRSRADEVLISPAFGLDHTRSPEAVKGRQTYARLQAKKKSVGRLNADEQRQLKLALEFVDPQAAD